MASRSMSSSKQRLASDDNEMYLNEDSFIELGLKRAKWISSRPRRNSGWNEYSAICKLYWHFLRKHINFVELVTVMRIHASPLLKWSRYQRFSRACDEKLRRPQAGRLAEDTSGEAVQPKPETAHEKPLAPRVYVKPILKERIRKHLLMFDSLA